MLTKVSAHSIVPEQPTSSAFFEVVDNTETGRCLSPNLRLVLRNVIKVIDICAIAIGFVLAERLVPHSLALDGPYLVAGSVGALLTFLCILQGRIYTRQALLSLPAQMKIIGSGLLTGAVAACAILWVLQTAPALSILEWSAAWGMGSALVILAFRIPLARYIRHAIASGLLARRFAVVGATDRGREIAEHIAIRNGSANHLVGVFDDGVHLSTFRHANAAQPAPGGDLVLGSIDDLILLSRRKPIDAIVIALPLTRVHEIDAVRRHLSCVLADVYVLPDIAGSTLPTVSATAPDATLTTALGENLVIKIMRRPLTDYQSVQKALFDRAVAAVVLIILAPLLLIIAAAIKFDSRGPVFFRQPRMGFNNVPFTVLKFRSMYHHMSDILADRQTSRDDPRVTRVGRILRKLSLDELPQLINVLRGDMSLVGPRPHAPSTKAEGHLLDDVVPEYAERHRIKPGITGWAQINGARGEIRSIGQIRERVRFDLHYIKNWSLLFDVKILFLTVKREIISSRAF